MALSVSVLAYNLTRVMNIVGIKPLSPRSRSETSLGPPCQGRHRNARFDTTKTCKRHAANRPLDRLISVGNRLDHSGSQALRRPSSNFFLHKRRRARVSGLEDGNGFPDLRACHLDMVRIGA